ncbi:hypothetical protein ABZ159_001226 [Listeria monocytogenes]
MTQTKMRNTIDETYKKLRNKLKTDEEITESDLLESLKLYEITNKELKKAKNKYRKWTEDEDAYLAYFAYSNDAKIQDEAETTVYNTAAGKNVNGYAKNKIEKILNQEGISFEEYGEYHRARMQEEENNAI